MTLEQESKLENIKNYATRYEVVASRGAVRLRVGYTMHKSRHGLLALCRAHGQIVISALGIGPDDLLVFVRTTPAKAHIGPAANPWVIEFTGRTQREAIIEGELPWIGSVCAEVRK